MTQELKDLVQTCKNPELAMALIEKEIIIANLAGYKECHDDRMKALESLKLKSNDSSKAD